MEVRGGLCKHQPLEEYHKDHLVVPEILRKRVLEFCHGTSLVCHPGIIRNIGILWQLVPFATRPKHPLVLQSILCYVRDLCQPAFAFPLSDGRSDRVPLYRLRQSNAFCVVQRSSLESNMLLIQLLLTPPGSLCFMLFWGSSHRCSLSRRRILKF